jgi:hypothetical protein
VCILCTVFCLIVVLFCMMCVICVWCLIVVPLPPGENPFAVKYKYIIKYLVIFLSQKDVHVVTCYRLDNNLQLQIIIVIPLINTREKSL